MSKEFDAWILSNIKNICLKIEELSWVDEFYSNSSDLVATLKLNSKEWKGHGHASSKDLALRKAITEAIERAISLQHISTSNGIAAHTNLESAKKNAQNELIERDLFLSHFITKTPFIKEKNSKDKIPLSIIKYINSNEDNVDLFKFKNNNMGEGYVCLISNSKNWGGIIGLSFGELNSKELITKAVVEAFRQYRFEIVTNKFKNRITLMDFNNLNKWNYADHGYLAQSLDYFQLIEFLFPKDESEQNSNYVKYIKEKFKFKIIDNSLPELMNCPLHVVQCTSEDMQQLQLGPCLDEFISIDGLYRFTGKKNMNINRLPHPIN